MMTWQAALKARTDLNPFGDNAIGLFALALRFGLEDLVTVASDSLVDGSGDKKIDLIYIDKDEGIAVIAQSYMRATPTKEAPANKASDLNTAIGWLFQRPISDLPTRIQSQASELRDSIAEGSITKISVWYIHNCTESSNVADELLTVESTLNSALKSAFNGRDLTGQALEVGATRLDEWYAETQSPILVTDKFVLSVASGFEISSENWKAFVTSIPAKFLHTQYRKHRTRLFSANVRDYLGSRKSDANINHGIKKTVEDAPQDFWVYNNGLTLLVNNYEFKKKGDGLTLTITGLSIVNGAQTTGAIGSLSDSPDATAMVPVRFVSTTDSETIFNIIQFNNSQNKIAPADFRSRDRIQKRLRTEFEKLPDAIYTGGRRGGYGDAIKRNPKLLPAQTVAQSLAAINKDPVVASNQKSQIWASDKLYSKYYNDETTAIHIIFAYGLFRAVENRKLGLIGKSKNAAGMTEVEERELSFFRNRGATYLLTSAVSSSLETILGRKVPNVSRLSFGPTCSPKKAERNWQPIVDAVTPFAPQLSAAFTHGLKNEKLVVQTLATFQSLVQATAGANKELFKSFSKVVKAKPGGKS